MFEVIPAIDLRAGRCVRLYQGDYAKETVYSDDPAEMAERWVSEGATRLHVVDLDGARDGTQANFEAVRKIVSTAKVPVQVGGGVRTPEVALRLLGEGVNRVIVGTVAVERPDVLDEIVRAAGAESVIVGIDSRAGRVAVKGWTESAAISSLDMALRMQEAGIRRIMFTDVTRDGTLTGPNFDAARELKNGTRLGIIAAGGISSSAQIAQLARLGIEGAVVGKAVYTGEVVLSEAIKLAKA